MTTLIAIVFALSLVVLTGCGVPHGDADRAKVLARTCLSTIIRNGLPAPTPAQIGPELFAERRRHLLDAGRQFNTISPYRDVCGKLRDQLRASTSVASQPTTATDEPDDAVDESTGP